MTWTREWEPPAAWPSGDMRWSPDFPRTCPTREALILAAARLEGAYCRVALVAPDELELLRGLRVHGVARITSTDDDELDSWALIGVAPEGDLVGYPLEEVVGLIPLRVNDDGTLDWNTYPAPEEWP